MKSLWINTFKQVPADAQLVWIKRLLAEDYPVKATFTRATGQFTWTDSATDTHQISLNDVSSWRPQ